MAAEGAGTLFAGCYPREFFNYKSTIPIHKEAQRMSAAQLILYLLVALLAGLLAERLVSTALPGGILGAIVAALLGMWLMLGVLHFSVPGDLSMAGVPLLAAILGAALVLVICVLPTGSRAC